MDPLNWLKRRVFLQHVAMLSASTAGLTLLSSACGLLAYRPTRVPRIGYLAPGPRESRTVFVDAFLAGIRDMGYVEGQTVSINWRFTPAGSDAAFTQAHAWPAQAAIVIPDGGMINLNASRIARLALQNGLPSITQFKSFVDSGLMMSFGTDTNALYVRAAFYVDEILRGAKPADLPVEEPRTLQLAVNMKTVQALGVTISSDVAAQVTDSIQ